MTSDFIETRCARAKKNVHENFVAIEYITYKKKVSNNKNKEIDVAKGEKLNNDEERGGSVDPKKQQELAMKRARHDVIKFGMLGLDNIEARKAKIASAIALGARPLKNQRTNYKKLKEDKRKVKEKANKKERVSGADKSLVKRKSRRKRSEKDSGILGIYGKVQKGPAKT